MMTTERDRYMANCGIADGATHPSKSNHYLTSTYEPATAIQVARAQGAYGEHRGDASRVRRVALDDGDFVQLPDPVRAAAREPDVER
jgi:hypothetical protein